MWHWSNQPGALLRCYGGPGCFSLSVIVVTLLHRFSLGFKSVQLFGTCFPIEMVLLPEKITFGHWVTVQLFFSSVLVGRFWCCPWFGNCLTLGMRRLHPIPWTGLRLVTPDALTPASVLLLWSSPKSLSQLCLTILSRIFFLHTISFQSTFHEYVNTALYTLIC